jgi:hypothetical protein
MHGNVVVYDRPLFISDSSERFNNFRTEKTGINSLLRKKKRILLSERFSRNILSWFLAAYINLKVRVMTRWSKDIYLHLSITDNDFSALYSFVVHVK